MILRFLLFLLIVYLAFRFLRLSEAYRQWRKTRSRTASGRLRKDPSSRKDYEDADFEVLDDDDAKKT